MFIKGNIEVSDRAAAWFRKAYIDVRLMSNRAMIRIAQERSELHCTLATEEGYLIIKINTFLEALEEGIDNALDTIARDSVDLTA